MSYVTITIRRIDVIGSIWMPASLCAMTYDLKQSDVDNIGELTRENVAKWLSTNSGDFQSIQDFRVDIADFESDFENADSERIFDNCMFSP